MAQNKEITAKTIIRNWRFILISMALFASVAFFVSTIIAPKYESQTQILILQKNMEIDAYRSAKASEFAGEVLKRVINSSEFMNGVLATSGTSIYKFGETPEDQLKNWAKTVKVSSVVNTGIVKITVLDESKKENKKLMETVLAELLNDNGAKYHGNGNINLKKIGGPVYFEDPAFPVIWLNVIIAAVIGLFFSLGVIFIKGEKIGSWFSDENIEYNDNF